MTRAPGRPPIDGSNIPARHMRGTFDDVMDWWMEWVLFLPMTLAQGHRGVIRLVAIALYPVWFIAMMIPTIVLILAHVLVMAYQELGKHV